MFRFSADGRALVAASLLLACSSTDATLLRAPDLPGVAEGTQAFLAFPERAEDWAKSPRFLSQTGGFDDVLGLQPSAGVLPYSVQAPLYSDGARKSRWLALPSGGQIEFSATLAWGFPEGTVFVKQFDMALDERQPEQLQRLETRFLVAARGGGYYGLVYQWNAEQTDAELLAEGQEEVLRIVGENGVTRAQTYTYPAQTDCPKCHSDIAGGVLGARTAQLNGDYTYPSGDGRGFRANQLATWEQLGFFDRTVGDRPLSEYPQLANLEDQSRPVDARIRSYWESNCAMCHNADSPIPSWDARYVTPLEKQGVLLAESYADPVPGGPLIVDPGDPEQSLMLQRATTSDPRLRMPPLLRNRVDSEYVALLQRWIADLTPP
jgi:uncharacterized repeat protein (TIGR03806 family)